VSAAATQAVTIPGAPRNPYVQRPELHYDYPAAPTRCPVCSRVAGGVPWHGWMACECGALCLVEDGRVFVPVRADEQGAA